MHTTHWSLFKRSILITIIMSGLSCSEKTSDQSLADGKLSWPAFTGAPGAGLKLIAFGPQQIRNAPGKALTDVVSHLPASYGNTYYDSDVVTWGHETSHGINAHLRNNFNTTGRKANGFYLLEDKAAVVAEPKILKNSVAEFIPLELRGSLFALYVTGQTTWDDTPLYLMDEFNAYINGAAVAIDLRAQGLWTYGQRDSLAGMLEFVSYSLALGMAVQKNDPEYFVTYPQFSELLAYEIDRAMNLYRQGSDIPEFQSAAQDQVFLVLTQSVQAAHLREFALRLYGSEWTNRVLLTSPRESAATASSSDHQVTDADDDLDTIVNRLDKCPSSPAGQKVWLYGDWIGCAEGEQRH